ncbi:MULTISPECIES: ABC transporter permease [unclassified Streptomyces]|uniref:ABC transporter permease n=1 Tax=unclassified Streptomyces TaxID=2593676 RepID=UPI001BEB024C|nr:MULTISPECIES: ABC transporter permease [unclassified Streptomyces]MBT2405451.1 ABC transporter permease [Streptomyces sp. ISL-21]MBT2608062.1 ABC transporter permease [Streptomyces sp. ISL-87]
MSWFRFTYSQFLLSQRVYWRDLGFALTGALLPLGLSLAYTVSQHGEGEIAGFDSGVYLLPGFIGFVLLWIVYNVINSAASRRDRLVYKRLRGTPLPDTAILAGEAASGSVTSLIQVAILVVAGVVAIDAPMPRNPLLLLVGIVLGALAFSLLAIGLSGLLPSGEVSTWIVTPVILLMMMTSGIAMPISSLPGWAQHIAPYLPSSPVVEIVRTAYLGRDFASDPAASGHLATVGFVASFQACAAPIGLLCAWMGLSFSMGKRFFRWDPRRSA